MARGNSGRIVLEVDPNIKRKLYLALEHNQSTLKDWFIKSANNYINTTLNDFDSKKVAEETPPYTVRL